MLFIYRNAVFAVDYVLIVVGMHYFYFPMMKLLFPLFLFIWHGKYSVIASRGEHIQPYPLGHLLQKEYPLTT